MKLITTKGDSIKYVVLEVLMNNVAEISQIWEDQKDKVLYGLLKGLENRKEVGKEEEKFILIRGSDKVTRVCNLEVYNILSLEIYDGIERDITFFRSSEEDQEAALQMISEVVELLKEAKKTLGTTDLIDVDKFTDIPKDFTGESDKSNSTANVVGGKYGATQHGTQYNKNTTAYNQANTYTRPEKEPTSFKRTSRKPTKIFLEKMRESVLAIQAGNYELNIPVIKNDDDPEEEETNATTGNTQKNLYDEYPEHFCC